MANTPFLACKGLRPIDSKNMLGDIVAGISLAVLAIPEVMGYTQIAGTPVITGLYTLLLPMLLFACFGASRHLVVGADSATAAILYAGLVGLAVPGSEEYTTLASVLALMAAAGLFLARILHLGFLADFLSTTVLIGFLTGIGIQVAMSQVPIMLGLEGSGQGPLIHHLKNWGTFAQTHAPSLFFSLFLLGFIGACRALSPRLPGPLLAIGLSMSLSHWLDFPAHGIAVLGPVPGGLPHLHLPRIQWSWSLFEQLLPTALSIFVVIVAQSAATARAYAARYQEPFDENRDLIGLGMANLGAGLSGSFVVNGSPTKTQMVDSAGGRSQLAHLVAALATALMLAFLTDALTTLPRVTLAVIVFLIGLDLIDLPGMRKIRKQAPTEFWVAVSTTVVVVSMGVEQGILLAMILSLLDHIRRSYRPKNHIIIPSRDRAWRSAPLSNPRQFLPGLLIYRFTHSLYYANAQTFLEESTRLAAQSQPPLRWFCVAASAIADIDYTAAETLRTVHAILQNQGIRLVFVSLDHEAMQELRRYGIVDLLGEDAFYANGDRLIQAYSKAYLPHS